MTYVPGASQIGFSPFFGAPIRGGGTLRVADVIVAYVTEMLTHQRKLPARWVKLRELLATPVEELELSKADLARLKKKHLARVGEALLAGSPAPEPLVAEVRKAASSALNDVNREWKESSSRRPMPTSRGDPETTWSHSGRRS